MSDSTWTFTCRNHRNKRWTKTKCGPGFIGRGVLMFEGDVDGKPAPFSFVKSERTLAETPPEYQREYRERYAVECDCPISDLVVVAREYQPHPSRDVRVA